MRHYFSASGQIYSPNAEPKTVVLAVLPCREYLIVTVILNSEKLNSAMNRY
ncbi:MAG: hypothetical protein IJ587_04400 [Synergistaceae bacterium]|nr:hypothetical protein [Synergistaceae bacterium]